MTPPEHDDVTRAARRLPHGMSRRGFITGLGAAIGLVAAEPVRRYFDMGANVRGDGFNPDGWQHFAMVRPEGPPKIVLHGATARDGGGFDHWQHNLPPQPIQCRCEVRGLYPDARTVDEGRPYFHTPEPFDTERAMKGQPFQERMIDAARYTAPDGKALTFDVLRWDLGEFANAGRG